MMISPIEILLDPISLMVLGIYAFLMMWEAIFPGRNLPRVKYWKIRGLASFIVFFYLSSYLPLFWDTFFASYQLFNIEFLGDYWGALLAVLVYEFGVYFWHRALHKSDRLWKTFHQMHHSAERLDSYGAFYFSPLDMIGWTLLGSISMVMIIGLTPGAATLALLTTTFLGMFQHTNIKTPRWLGYFIQRPESHTVHHAKGVHAFNYSDLPIFDMIFGTFQNPSSYEHETGFYPGASKRILDMLKGMDVTHPRKKKSMKTLISIALCLISIQLTMAQVINYQGAIRDVEGSPMSQALIHLRISFHENGQVLYSEEHRDILTNEVGLFNASIGSIHPEEFSILNFNENIKIMTEISHGGPYELISFKPISAVPLALHARTVDDADDADADPNNEIQRIAFDESTFILSLTDGGNIDLSVLKDDIEGGDDQTLNLNGTSLSIENGNQVDLSILQDGVDDEDASPVNEIQTLSFDATNYRLHLTDGGSADLSMLKDDIQINDSDDQTLSLSGTRLSIEDGNQVDLSGLRDGVKDSDADPENEIQKISLNRNNKIISLSKGGGSIDLDDVLPENTFSPWNFSEGNIYYNSSGNVGIGLKNASASLEIYSSRRADSGFPTLRLTSRGGAVNFNHQRIQTMSARNYYINPLGGNVNLGFDGNAEKLGQVNIPNANFGIALQLAKGGDANLNKGSGYFVIGQTDRKNIVFDDNEIQSRNNGQPSSLVINNQGGALYCGGLRNIGSHLDMQYNPATKEIGFDNSSRRYKSNISTLRDDWHKILKTRPVQYDRPQSPGQWEFGYIAEEFDDIGLTNLVQYDTEGLPSNINYRKMVIYLTEMIKELDISNRKLEARISELENKQ